MSMFKRITAALLVFAATVCVCCSCNQSKTKVILTTADGDEVASGVYLLYLTQAISELDEKIEEAEYTGDKWAYTDEEITDAVEWVKNTALNDTLEMVAVEQQFEALGLSFTDDEQSNLDYICEYYWSAYGESYEEIGVSYASFARVYKVSSMGGEIIDHIYGEGGEKEITDEDYKAYMEENYSRVNHILISCKDDDDVDLTGDELTAAEEKAKELLAEAQTADEDTFRQLIIDNSADYTEGSTDLDTGYVAPLESSGYVTEFEDAIKALKPGETSTELCKSEYGWHIIRRYEVFGDDLVDVDEYKDTLITLMTEDDYDAMKAEWVKDLKYDLVEASFKRYDPTDDRFDTSEE